MADIFLSYAREDRERASPIVAALETCGWTVFWDSGILPGPRFRQVIEKELAAARCAVVLWSKTSVESEWVHSEAQRALDRGVLLAARIDTARLPLGFSERQSADLANWNADPEAPAFQTLVRAIRALIGGRADIVLCPIDLNLITGDREKHGELPPTVNMMCGLSNSAKLPVVLDRLELVVAREGRRVYQLSWHLFYDAIDREHQKIKRDRETLIAGETCWRRGVQFREANADIPNVWPEGSYAFEWFGWTDRPPAHTVPNLKTTFRADVTPWHVHGMTKWSRATKAEWDERNASDRALGFPLDLTDITTGL